VLPAGIPADLEAKAEALASAIIAKLDLEGLLCVEMFVTRQGELLVNELRARRTTAITRASAAASPASSSNWCGPRVIFRWAQPS